MAIITRDGKKLTIVEAVYLLDRLIAKGNKLENKNIKIWTDIKNGILLGIIYIMLLQSLIIVILLIKKW
jgi:hypothetical protein